MLRDIAIIFVSNVIAFTLGYWKGSSVTARVAEKIIDALKGED